MNIALISDIFLCTATLLWFVYASITDLRKREVANWVSMSLIFIALMVRSIVSIILGQSILVVLGLVVLFLLFFYLFVKEKPMWMQIVGAVILIAAGFLSRSFNSFNQISYLSTGFIAFGILFIIAILAFYGRVFGGADAKLLMALAFVFATTPSFLSFSYFLPVDFFGFSLSKSSFLVDFIINSLLISVVYGFVFSVIMAIRNRKRFSIKFKEVNSRLKIFKIIFLIIGVLFLILGIFQRVLIVPAVLILILPWFYAFISSVEQGVLVSYKSWNKLEEGDWLVESTKIGKKILKPSAEGLSKEEILLIKKSGKKVVIRDGIAYVPVFLLSIIVSLFLGNLFLRLLILLA
jgi:Flp pilus assembly protein protease CpaA